MKFNFSLLLNSGILVGSLLGSLVGCGGSTTTDTRLTMGFGVTQAILVPYTADPSTCAGKYGSVQPFMQNEDAENISNWKNLFSITPTPTPIMQMQSSSSVGTYETNLNYYLKFSYPTLTWASTDSKVEIILVTFKMKSPSVNGGAEFSQVIEVAELGAMYASAITANASGTYDFTNFWAPTTLPWYAASAPSTAVYSKTPNSACSYFLIKGISLSKKSPFVAKGTFEVIGVETVTATGVQKPVKSTTTVNIESVGI